MRRRGDCKKCSRQCTSTQMCSGRPQVPHEAHRSDKKNAAHGSGRRSPSRLPESKTASRKRAALTGCWRATSSSGASADKGSCPSRSNGSSRPRPAVLRAPSSPAAVGSVGRGRAEGGAERAASSSTSKNDGRRVLALLPPPTNANSLNTSESSSASYSSQVWRRTSTAASAANRAAAKTASNAPSRSRSAAPRCIGASMTHAAAPYNSALAWRGLLRCLRGGVA
mmetsp:Transcript_9033/g.25888  ORF Transcript_9033/g.25888 Transcript_9033/m.25888 type:complete len:225 (+) Transcript_9033:637-1311(+)